MDGNPTNGSEAAYQRSEDDGAVIVDDDGEVSNEPVGDSIPIIDPVTITSEPDPSEQPRRRGRPRGTRNSGSGYAASRKQEKQAANDLTLLLMSLHHMGAAFAKIPELELEQDEAKRISDAVVRLNELYGGMVIPEKAQAWLNLMMASGAAYGPRFIAYNIRIKKEKSGEPQTVDGHVNRVM